MSNDKERACSTRAPDTAVVLFEHEVVAIQLARDTLSKVGRGLCATGTAPSDVWKGYCAASEALRRLLARSVTG